MKMNSPNFSEYSLKELLEVYQDIDRNTYPDRFEILTNEIQKRKASIASKHIKNQAPTNERFKKGLSIIINIYILLTTIEVIKTTIKGTFQNLFYSEFHYALHLITNYFTVIIGFLAIIYLFINSRKAGYFQSLWFLPQLIILLKKTFLNPANSEFVILRSYDALVGFHFTIGFGFAMSPPTAILIKFNLFALLGIVLALYASQALSNPMVGDK